MFNDSASFFVILFNNIDSLMLIAARIVGLFVLMPVLSSRGFPRLGKMGFIFFISTLIFTARFNENLNIEYANSFIGFGVVIFKEFTLGYILGFSVYTVLSSVYFAGQLMDFQIGFSMVSIFDPISQIQLPVSGNIMSLAITAMLVVSGALHVFLDAMFYSYEVLPIGSVNIVINENIVKMLISTMSYFFIFCMKVAMPLVGTILIINVALGLLVKASPQMNVFVVGMPVKVIVGLIIFYLIMPMMTTVFDELFNHGIQLFYGIIENFN